ncbi:MAG: lipopolysaccharide biosynthesis protein [Shewanella sp.]|nr:lipopolysaccharide biosynthesis protein [Shewanella sp.]MCF1457152.1 lipopolysaccharide biosynthesis protein [Shewanella sp.]
MSQPNIQPQLTPLQRKLRKLKRDPKLFLVDSKAYVTTRKTLYLTWAKLGSFALVILASLLVVFYYTWGATPRYVSQVQFVVKQSGNSEIPLAGLAAIGASSPSMRDALILKQYIESPEMAMALNSKAGLKEHYESTQWDVISRLTTGSTQEEYVEYFLKHTKVNYDEMSEILKVEIQSFEPAYSLQLAQALISVSETFINQLGEDMAKQQLIYAEQEVDRAYQTLKAQQLELIAFQDKFELYSPEAQSTALVAAMNTLESEVIAVETELKSLSAYMQPDAAEVKAKQFKLNALKQQLAEEKVKLTKQDAASLNKVNIDFKDIELNTAMAADLYKSALTSLEMVRAEAFKKLKHLLIVEQPRLAQEESYPKRFHSIFTWFAILLLTYFVGRLVLAIIRDHRD